MHELFPLVECQILKNQITCNIFRKVWKQWDQILRRNQYIFIWECIINLSLFSQFMRSLILQSTQVVGYLIISPLSILHLKIKILHQQYQYDLLSVDILLFHLIPQSRVVGIHYDPRAKQIGENIFIYKHHHKTLLISCNVVLLVFIQGFTCVEDG